jgi:anti-sigma factor ChrR (cupin superfamily)
MTHECPDKVARDQAALYALGSMRSEEAASYARHLEQCAACHREVDSLSGVARDLVLTAPEDEPPPGLKQRLLSRVRGAGLTLLRASEAAWQPSGVPGVDVRALFVDAASDRQTILVRMAPRSSYPRHAHGGTEECYVIQGDLIEGGVVMRAGDYSRFEGGTQHGPLTTERGCLLLVVSSLHDEVVERPSV